ncbi:hypothetical protein BJX64DRAFT_54701 [Aspergillus heterothallicus]
MGVRMGGAGDIYGYLLSFASTLLRYSMYLNNVMSIYYTHALFLAFVTVISDPYMYTVLHDFGATLQEYLPSSRRDCIVMFFEFQTLSPENAPRGIHPPIY